MEDQVTNDTPVVKADVAVETVDETNVDTDTTQDDANVTEKAILTSEMKSQGLTQEDIDKINEEAGETAKEVTDEDGNETDESTKESEEKSFLDVKYLGETKPLTKEQTLEYAQIGMNQNRLQTKFDNLKASDGQKWLESQAKEFGMENVSELVIAFQQSKLDTAKTAFEEKHFYLEPDALDELWKTHSAEEQRNIDEVASKSKTSMDAEQAEKLDQDYKSIKDTHGIDKDDVPKEVITSAEKNNISLTDAYNRHFIEKLLPKMKEDIRNETLAKVGKNNATTSQPLSKSAKDTGISDEEFEKLYASL